MLKNLWHLVYVGDLFYLCAVLSREKSSIRFIIIMEGEKSKNGEIADRISTLLEEAISLAEDIEEDASPVEELTPVSALTCSLYEARGWLSDVVKGSSASL